MADHAPLLTSLHKARELVLSLSEGNISDLHAIAGCFRAIKQMSQDAAISSVAEVARYYGEDACNTFERQIHELLAAIDAAIMMAGVAHFEGDNRA